MRSGLHKPPFLALVIFLLVSLAPTVAEQWGFQSIHLGYLGFSRYSSPRVKNSAIDTRPRLPATDSQCKWWLFGDFYSSCTDRDTHPHQSVMNTPPRSSFEATPEPEYDHATYPALKEPSSITRGVSAFKEFVIKRWDEQQTTRPLPPRHDSVHDHISTQPTPTPVDSSDNSVSSSGKETYSTPPDGSDPMSTTDIPEDSLLLFVPLFIYETWQQVCHAGGHYLESWTSRPHLNSHTDSLISENPAPGLSGGQAHTKHLEAEEHQTKERSTDGPSNESETESDLPAEGYSLVSTTLSLNSAVPTAGQSTDTGHGQDLKHRRGSSMAIVIGLVVGIMWL
ncbi:hypothetical protein BJX99DRAFT_261491 [Aspergillus californicus]